MIRLDYMNLNPVPANDSPALIDPNTPGVAYQRTSYYETVLNRILPHFTANVRLVSPSLYTLAAQDLCNYLACEISLEIQEGQDETEFGIVTCHFPIIQEDYLEAFLWGEELLVDMVSAQFHLKVLEQILRFCANHNATRLIICVSSSQSSALQFYRPIIAHTETLACHARKDTLLTIHPDRATYEKLILNMHDLGREFQDMLEEEKLNNPIIQQYLTLMSFGCPDQENF